MLPNSDTPGYDKDRWMRALEAMAISLGKDGPPVKLCLIGSAACLLGNMPGRTSRDLDVWKPSSTYDSMELQSAAADAGVVFNPKETIEPDDPYLQIVEPGIVQMGEFEPVLLDRMGRLELYRPPIENIIASKLTRAADKDIQDILYLLNAHQPDRRKIKNVVESFPAAARSVAEENLVYLEITH